MTRRCTHGTTSKQTPQHQATRAPSGTTKNKSEYAQERPVRYSQDDTERTDGTCVPPVERYHPSPGTLEGRGVRGGVRQEQEIGEDCIVLGTV